MANALGNRIGRSAVVALVAIGQIVPLPHFLPLPAPVALVPAAAQSGSRPFRVNCYAPSNGSRTCDLPRNTRSVTYVGPDRSNRCREGDTWRRRGNELWVSNGCGGTFEAIAYESGSGGNWGGSGGSWGGSGGGRGFAGEITCRSRDNRTEECYARTEGRVQLLQQYSSSPCVQGQTWRYTNNNISVRNGCQARFGYGYGNSGGGGGWGGNSGFAGQLECRSDDNRYRRCSVRTENRVEMLRQFSNTSCVRGRTWGYDGGGIWVDNGCQARFGYGYGNVSGDTSGSSSGGSDAGAIIGGAALAAGLIALLATAGKSSSSSSKPTVAAIDADLAKFPSDARVPGEACLKEAARQIGATGGTRVRLEGIDSAQRAGEGWMILAPLTGTWPDHSQKMRMDCRANGSQVTAFDVR